MVALAQSQQGTGSARSGYERYSDCEICEGTGWIYHDAYDEAGRRVEQRPPEKCVCRKRNDNMRRIRRSGLSLVIDELTMDSFKTGELWQGTMKSTAQKYVEAILNGEAKTRPWFYLGGAVGCGKTHIATAICGELLNKGISVRYMQWLPEARRIKSLMNEETLDDILYDYAKDDVLYIDDLFKQQHRRGDRATPTDSDIRIAFMLLNQRYIERKATIITSEWKLTDDLFEIDEGTFSRVYERTKGGYLLEINEGPEKNWRRKDPGETGGQ